MITRVYVSIGSNIEPERHVREALRELREAFGRIEVSPVYRTAAVGFDGDDFLNLVVGFETEHDVHAVDDALDAIEQRARRERAGERFAPRTLDLDLLLFGDCVIDDGHVRVPRQELLEYAFMLKPLADLAPDLQHPTENARIADLLQARNFRQQRCVVADLPADSDV